MEIGTEELPAGVIDSALAALAQKFAEMVAGRGLTYSSLKTFGTPRRLAMMISELAAWQDDRTDELLGPPVSIALDSQGKPLQAAISFAQKAGVAVEDLVVRPGKRGDVLAAIKRQPGRPTAELLMEMLPQLVASIPFPKTMRWEESGFRFSRPIRWMVALLGEDVIPFRVADITAGRETWGHRVLAVNPVVFTGPEGYEERLLDAYVVADSEKRLERIKVELAALSEQGYRVLPDAELLATVNNLVEWPRVALGEFEPKYLSLPREIIITVLRHHLKVFSIENTEGQLINRFAVVLATEPASLEHALKGFVRVIRARMEDAQYFYREDCKLPLADRVKDLAGMLYLKGLGTALDRSKRLETCASDISERVAPDLQPQARRAAQLCKADLTTLMVNEFPELQGVMGYLYALHEHEQQEIAVAIKEHYQPRWAGDALPSNTVGSIVALADKADAIAGCYALGLIPKGSHDPYALRRAAIGILRIMEQTRYKLGFRGLLAIAFESLAAQGVSAGAGVREDAETFVEGRVRALFADRFPEDLIDSVLAIGCDVPYEIAARLQALHAARKDGWFDAAAAAFKRIQNISKDQPDADYNADVLVEPAEQALIASFQESKTEIETAVAAEDYAQALSLLARLKPRVDSFFEEVFVMAEDPEVRRSRLGLLRSLAACFAFIADFTRIQVEQKASKDPA